MSLIKDRKTITINDIAKADEIKKGKEANLLNTAVLLGISGEENEAIHKKLHSNEPHQNSN